VSLLLGYNTNGFAHHRLDDALEIIAGIGYRSVGLTLDVHHAPPASTDFERLGRELANRGLLPVVETGARFLLDARRKHWPSLLTPDPDARARRMGFYYDCVGAAAALGAPCISLWSGRSEGGDDWALLTEGLTALCRRAASAGVAVAFEPEPGMFIETMAQFEELRTRVPDLKLTLDVGHIHCLDDGRPAEVIVNYAEVLANVHLDDHRRGTHEHLMFGEGEIDWPPVMAALEQVASERGLPATVELSRHSPMAVEAAEKAYLLLAMRM